MSEPVQILGGGPAGSALAYFASKAALPFDLFEAKAELGGNCITLSEEINGEKFHFDSGAHRFHDKSPHSTKVVKELLGEDLLEVHSPSQICYQGKFIDFPLRPLNLLKKMGPLFFARAGTEILGRQWGSAKLKSGNFEEAMLSKYGPGLASRFLLNYSEKLWGLPTNQLSVSVSGSRLKGLNLKTFFIESLFGKKAGTKHLDGSFLYPKKGYGQILKEMTQGLPSESVHFNSRVEHLLHEDYEISEIIMDDGRRFPARKFISTLPLNILIKALKPAPEEEIIRLAESIRFRGLFLCVIFLNKPSVSDNATIYFPESAYPFTRISEPRNRSKEMSPDGKTSLMIEIPVHNSGLRRFQPDIEQKIISPLLDLGFFKKEEILAYRIIKMPHAYPVLEIGYEEKVRKLMDYLSRYRNLELSGRNGLFQYTHLHDLINDSHRLITGM